LVNDLELRIQRLDSAGAVVETYFPWVLNRNNPAAAAERPNTGNHVDIVEQVLVQGAPALQPDGQPWRYRVTVNHVDNLTGAQAFSVVISAGSVEVARNVDEGTVTFVEAIRNTTDCLILRRNAAGQLEYSSDGVLFSNDLDTAMAGVQTMATVDIHEVNIRLGEGNDQAVFEYAPPSASVDGGAGTDRLTVTTTAGSGKITLKDTQLKYQAAAYDLIGIEEVNVSGGAMKDTISAKKFTLGSVTIAGGAGDDALTGTNLADVIRGGAGNDSIKEVNGADLAEGGDGNDNLNGGNEDDTLLGEAGDDKLTGVAGADSLDGGAGNDNLNGGNENDTLLGLAGNDMLTGAAGNDSLDGGEGADTLDGSAGVDTCFVGPPGEGDPAPVGCE
jgi:Ca2+-binding RTX toxin-like protein